MPNKNEPPSCENPDAIDFLLTEASDKLHLNAGKRDFIDSLLFLQKRGGMNLSTAQYNQLLTIVNK